MPGLTNLFSAAKLELDLKTRNAGPAAAAQKLHHAQTPAESEPVAVASRRSGRARSVLRWFSTAVLYAAFLGLGMSVAILGPTFQDLAENVNRNISNLSLIFVGRATGFLCGTTIGGILFDHMNQFFLLGASMVATTVTLYLIPFCKTAVLLIITMSAFGASVGVVDTGETDLQEPNLEKPPSVVEVQFPCFVDDMNLLWAYASIGTYVLVVSVFLFALFCEKRSKQKKSSASAQEVRRAKYHRALLCLLFLFFFFYVGAEITYGSYVFSFATTHVGMEESEAAGLNSIFWGTFAACRGLAIFFATCLRPGTMIVVSNIGSLASSFFLVLFDKSPLCLWIATSVYGASMATTFPSGISWIEQYTTLTGKSAAFFVIGAALGEMAIPAVIGILQGHYPDLPVVLYTCLCSAIFTAVLFPVMYKLATLPLERQRKGRRKSEDQKALPTSSRL
eukprot:XP_006256601.2 PREDICTED: sodium-dependent glucose transporter 1A isoform X1 [Rattus norvegicus]